MSNQDIYFSTSEYLCRVNMAYMVKGILRVNMTKLSQMWVDIVKYSLRPYHMVYHIRVR